MKFGLCTSMDNYDQLYEIGYDYIEIAGTEAIKASNKELKELRKKIDDYGVPCIGFNSYCDASLPIVGSGYNPSATADYAERICEKAVILGAKALGIGSPLARKLPLGYDVKRADEQAADFLLITAGAAKKYDITILFESLCAQMCDYMIHTPEALAMVKKLNARSGNIKMVLDFYHMSMMKEDVSEIAYVMPYVNHLHISGFKENGERIYLTEEQKDHYRLAVQSAKKWGYDRTISIEADTNNFTADAVRSLDILKNL